MKTGSQRTALKWHVKYMILVEDKILYNNKIQQTEKVHIGCKTCDYINAKTNWLFMFMQNLYNTVKERQPYILYVLPVRLMRVIQILQLRPIPKVMYIIQVWSIFLENLKHNYLWLIFHNKTAV